MRPKVTKWVIKLAYLISVTSPNFSNITLFARLSIGLVTICFNSMWQVLLTLYMKTSASMSRTSRVLSKTPQMLFSGQKTWKYTKKNIFWTLEGRHKHLENMDFLNFCSMLTKLRTCTTEKLTSRAFQTTRIFSLIRWKRQRNLGLNIGNLEKGHDNWEVFKLFL